MRQNTVRQYECYIRKWFSFATENRFTPNQPTLALVCTFLNKLTKQNVSYSTVSTAKAALNHLFTLWDISFFREHETFFRKFMKGIWNKNPTLKCTDYVWDPSLVLLFIENQMKNEVECSFLMLTKICATIIALSTSCRIQTLSILRIDGFTTLENGDLQFEIVLPTKQTRPNFHQSVLRLSPFHTNEFICPIRIFNLYLQKSKPLRHQTPELFITTCKPHKNASPATIGRWIKSLIEDSGIRGFGAHSTRSASTSVAGLKNVSTDVIMSKAGWTSESTFAKHYKKFILKDNIFQTTVLKTL